MKHKIIFTLLGFLLIMNLDAQKMQCTLNASILQTETCNSYVLTAYGDEYPWYLPLTYSWSTGAISQSIDVVSVGIYTVTITDNVGCTDVASYTIYDQFVPLSGEITTTNPICWGATIQTTPIGGHAPYSYSWEDHAHMPVGNFQNFYAGTGLYYVTITDANGCTWSGSHQVLNAGFWPKSPKNTTGTEIFDDIITDPLDGSVYAIGTYSGTIDLDQNAIYEWNTFAGGRSIFVIHYDICGQYINHRVYGGISDLNSYNLKLKLIYTNDLIVAGEYTSIDFTAGGNPLHDDGSRNAFVAILDRTSLTASPNNQVSIWSESSTIGAVDNLKGLSVGANGTWIMVTGGFSGSTLYGSPTNWTNRFKTGANTDLYVCRLQYNPNTHLLQLVWDRTDYSDMYSDMGMSCALVNTGNFYFTYLFGNDPNNPNNQITRIVKLDNGGNVVLGPEQVGNGSDFYYICDMVGGPFFDLYLCGYYKSSSDAIYQRATVIRYPPGSQFIWNNATHIEADQESPTVNRTNVATHLFYNNDPDLGQRLYVAGAYDYDNFKLGIQTTGPWSQPIQYHYGAANHFVFKTDNMLTPANGWLTGAMTGTDNGSYATAICYDAPRNVYYISGLYTGHIVLNDDPNVTNQFMDAQAGYDGFIARFIDNNEAEFRKAPYMPENSVSQTDEIINSDFQIYPNPASNKININMFNSESINRVDIIDITGRIVFSEKNIGSDNTELNISKLSQGTYVVNIKTDYNNFVTKINIVN